MVGAYFAASTLAQELVALGVGVALITWVGQSKKFTLAKFTGYLIAILSAIALVHTLYHVATTDAAIKRAKAHYMHDKAEEGMEKRGQRN